MSLDTLEELGRLLGASIAAGRFHEAERLIDECVAVHSLETHHAVVAVLGRAREVALVQRAIAADRRAQARQAALYSDSAGTDIFLANA